MTSDEVTDPHKRDYQDRRGGRIEVVRHGLRFGPRFLAIQAAKQALACADAACPATIFTLFQAICLIKGRKIAPGAWLRQRFAVEANGEGLRCFW